MKEQLKSRATVIPTRQPSAADKASLEEEEVVVYLDDEPVDEEEEEEEVAVEYMVWHKKRTEEEKEHPESPHARFARRSRRFRCRASEAGSREDSRSLPWTRRGVRCRSGAGPPCTSARPG